MPAILSVYVILALSGACAAGIFLGRRRYRPALLALILTSLTLLGWYQATRTDLVASWLYASDTVYSSGFSQRQFNRVQEGMSPEALLALLGEPLDRRLISAQQEYWYYSRHGTSSQNYWNFIVIVDPTARRVSGRFKEFYTD